MIVCKLELWVGGDPDNVEHLGVISMTNDLVETLKSNGDRGTYDCKVWKKRHGKKSWKQVKVTDFPRLSYHPWNLVREVLNLVAKQNGGRL